MQTQRNKRRQIAEMNVVPYIDVMLVLLVIFMVTAPLLTQGVEVELPQVTTNPIETKSPDPLVVTIDKQGRLTMNVGENPKEGVQAEDVQKRVRVVLKNKPDTPILVRGDRAVDYGSVVKLMTLLQAAGAESVGLVTELPET
jgi:biopolymer transport protein TolR